MATAKQPAARRPRRSTRVSTALTAALKHVNVAPADGALVALAKAYAAQIDAAEDAAAIARATPAYLNVLAELGMTPRSRSGPAGPAGGSAGGGAPGGSNNARTKFDELRQRRRQRGAAAVDPAAP